jgi:basic amino acid/polyamine antiporter, APA family
LLGRWPSPPSSPSPPSTIIRKTVGLTKIVVGLVLVALAACLFATLAGGSFSLDRIWPLEGRAPRDVLQAAGLLFFAFAGYARIATLGEEVVDPARTIPRAIPVALGLTLLVYAAVLVSALGAAGSTVLAASPAPLADAIRVGRFAPVAIVVRMGAAVASLGVLLSLIVGVSRTLFAMAAAGDLPAALAAVHPRYAVPHRAELIVGGCVAVLVASLDVGQAIGFSSFTVLAYYAIANASALTLTRHERRWPRPLAAAGLGGCVLVAASLPARTVWSGLGVLSLGLATFGIARAIRPR